MPIKDSLPRESLRVPLATTRSRSLASIESSISGHALTMSAGPPSSSFVVIVVVVVVVVVVEKPSMLPEKETSEKTCTIRHRLKEQNFLLNRGPKYSIAQKAQTKPPPFPRGVYPPACVFFLLMKVAKRKKRNLSSSKACCASSQKGENSTCRASAILRSVCVRQY